MCFKWKPCSSRREFLIHLDMLISTNDLYFSGGKQWFPIHDSVVSKCRNVKQFGPIDFHNTQLKSMRHDTQLGAILKYYFFPIYTSWRNSLLIRFTCAIWIFPAFLLGIRFKWNVLFLTCKWSQGQNVWEN